jgi:hypothetical protein
MVCSVTAAPRSGERRASFTPMNITAKYFYMKTYLILSGNKPKKQAQNSRQEQIFDPNHIGSSVKS